MRLATAIMATTHLDSQNERFTVGALRSMADQVQEKYVPVWIEHDIARPPLGRTVVASVVPLGDGNFGLESVAELWNVGEDPDKCRGDGRRLVLFVQEVDGLSFGYDFTFRDHDGKTILKELHSLGNVEIKHEGKKSAVVISQLTIAVGIFFVGGIAGGFLQAVGVDMYNSLKEKLKAIRSKPGNEKATRLLFRFTLRNNGQEIEANAVLDDATPQMIEEFYSKGLNKLDRICEKVMERRPDTVRIVTQQTEEDLQLLYDVRDDGFPFTNDSGGI